MATKKETNVPAAETVTPQEEDKTGVPPQTPPGEGPRGPCPGPTPARGGAPQASPLDPEESSNSAADNEEARLSALASNSRRRGESSAVSEREEKREEKSVEAKKTGEAGGEAGLAAVGERIREARLAGWQEAALLRNAGWTADKMVTKPEFDRALGGVMNRAQGARTKG